jgi:Cns1/TTC4 Wheel domain
VRDDCLEARKYKQTEQVYTVLARSRIFLERYKEAVEYCLEGVKLFPDSIVLKSVLTKAREEESKELKRIEDVSTIQAMTKDKKLSVYRNLRQKKVKLGKRIHFLPEIVELQITEDADGTLHFPVLLLYDEYMATDFIQDWQQDMTLKDQLTQVFAERAPWDEQGKYRMDTIEVYFEADQTSPLDPRDKSKDKSTKKYVRCTLDQTLLQVLQHKFHIVPQYPVLKVICKHGPFKESFLNEI